MNENFVRRYGLLSIMILMSLLLSAQTDILQGKRKKEIHYANDEHASGGMVVRYAGGRRENSIVWDNVWSDNGGRYELYVSYTPADKRQLDVYVNGTLTNGRNITLKRGSNIIEISSNTSWCPDIDKIEIKKL